MELAELESRLTSFCSSMFADPAARVRDVEKMPGHAGFSWGFTVLSHGVEESFVLRLPPPNTRWRGTADVLRQVEALNALEGSDVPHCTVRWSGSSPEWFGCPYFLVPKLEGDIVRLGPGQGGDALDTPTRRRMAAQAMRALAGIHRIDPSRAPYLGTALPLEDDVERWDRFLRKVSDQERLKEQPRVRELLLKRLPPDAPVGIFHGDFQWSNLFFSRDHQLLAVIDWELVGIGATLNDVGWIATFNDAAAWAEGRSVTGRMLEPDELVELYRELRRELLPDIDWFRALAAYKFAIITGFNLALHRRGKRPDPIWETTALSIEPLLQRALELLSA